MKIVDILFSVKYEYDVSQKELAAIKKIAFDILDNYSFGVESNWSKQCVLTVKRRKRK